MDIVLLVADIVKKQCSILQLIESLQPDLTSTKADQRASAVGEVANVLQRLPPALLNEQEVTTLVQFLCLKLSDHFSVSSQAISGLKALCACINLSDEAAEAVFRSVSSELQVQTLNQSERLAVYTIFQLLLQNKLHFLKGINHDFVFGFVQAIDAEKDPRNLLLVFELFSRVVAEFDISRFREDMFEVIACYFPIDFTPSAAGSVTREQLVQLHTGCLASTPVFAEFMVPLLLEKLASDLRSARLESFNLLRHAAPVYPADALLAYGQQLLAAFRRAMFRSAVSDEERRAGLAAFAGVAARIAGADDNTASRDEFFGFLLKECRPNLRELDPNVMEATGRALEAATETAGASTRRLLVTGILPDILAGLTDRKDSASKCGLLDILRRLLHAALSPPPPSSPSPGDAAQLVAHLSGELESIGASLYGLAHVAASMGADSDFGVRDQLRVGCLAVMARLCGEPGLANAEQRVCLAEHLIGELGGGGDRRRLPGQLTRPLVRDYVRRLATKTAPAEAADLVAKELLPLATVHADAGVRAECLLLLGDLCNLPAPISESLLQLLMRLCLEADSEAQRAAAAAIKPRLEALRLATETAMASGTRLLAIALWTGHFEGFLRTFGSGCGGDAESAAAFDCVQAFSRSLSADDELSSVKSFVDWTVQQALGDSFCRLHCALLYNVAPETAKRHAVSLLPRLFSHYAADGAEFAIELYASLANKCLDYGRDPAMSLVEQRLLADVDAVLAGGCLDERLAPEFLAWCLKALLLSGSPLFAQLARRALDILRGDGGGGGGGLAVQLASRLELLLTPCDRVLCAAAKSIVGPLAGQKCLCLLLQPLLVEARRNEACLLAAISLAQSAPPDLIVDYIDSLIPALMLHLQPSSGAGLRAPILRLLETLASRQAALGAMAPRCLSDLLPRLLACLEPGADLDARRTSARLLRRLATGGLPTAELLPHRAGVISRLGAALNDPKRLARGDAARARNAWFLVG